MARLVDCYPPGEDGLPDVNILLQRPEDVEAKAAATAAPRSPVKSPVKNLVPKSAAKPSSRRVRRLGDGGFNVDNPLFRRWNAEDDEDDSTLRGSPRKSPSKSRLISQRLQANSTQQSISELEDDASQSRIRPLRLARPRITSTIMDEDDSEEPSSDMSLAPSLQAPKLNLPTTTQKSEPTLPTDNEVVETEQVQLAEAIKTQLEQAPTLESASSTISEEPSVYGTPGESSTDSSKAFDSDFAADESSGGPRKMSPAKLLFGRPQQDPNSKAEASPSKSFLALKPRHPNLKTESPSGQDKDTPSKPKALFCSTQGSDENGKPVKSSQATAGDLADALSKLRLEFHDLSESDDDAATTPPTTPPKTLQSKTLVSPNKRALIPKTPHRPSGDAFWSKDLVDDWNDEHSPRKLVLPPVAKSPTKASPTKADKKSFEARKHSLAEEFLGELDAEITQGKIAALAESTGGVKLVWTKTLNTTAGRANWKRETLRTKQADGTEVSVRYKHHASIELAEKVIDDESRLLNVLAHEFCHLANFMVNGVTTNPHGREFKVWATRCSRAFGSRGVEVTTKHTYEIDFKYVWACGACGSEYKRHSRSIDPQRHRCGTCKGELKQTRPVPRAGASGPSEYQVFMKEHMKLVREENPGSPQKDVMRMVADRWAKRDKNVKGAKAAEITEVAGAAEAPVEAAEIPGAVEQVTVVEAGEEHVVSQMIDLTLDD